MNDSAALKCNIEPVISRCTGLPAKALQELKKRGMREAAVSFLLVNFYRIRRKTALRLPLNDLPMLSPRVGIIENYPWMLWIIWKLEARLLSLAAAERITTNAEITDVFRRDVRALCRWDSGMVGSSGQPLFGSHLLRCLTYLLDSTTADASLIEARLEDLLFGYRQLLDDRRQVLRDEVKNPQTWPKSYYNINCIPIFAMALAARRIEHPRRAEIEETAAEISQRLGQARREGWTEGWSYDAFVQDFLADWLLAAPEYAGKELSEAFKPSLLEPMQINCPGGRFNPPILADAECPEMFFHWSAVVKWHAITGDRDLLAGLENAPMEDVSSDALLWWPAEEISIPQRNSPMRTPNAVVLGDCPEPEVLVTVGAAGCQNGHLQADRGHICVGAGGDWVVQDPGYRQYLRTSEHHFATGVTAHNVPVVDGQGENLEGVRAIPLNWPQPILDAMNNAAMFELTGFYGEDLELISVKRKVRAGSEVIVEDLVSGRRDAYEVSYYWHFHPEAYLGEEAGNLLLVLGDQVWQVTCEGLILSLAQVSRLRGSRGQQTLSVNLACQRERVIRWFFKRIQ